jgi:hypothetical protein
MLFAVCVSKIASKAEANGRSPYATSYPGRNEFTDEAKEYWDDYFQKLGDKYFDPATSIKEREELLKKSAMEFRGGRGLIRGMGIIHSIKDKNYLLNF